MQRRVEPGEDFLGAAEEDALALREDEGAVEELVHLHTCICVRPIVCVYMAVCCVSGMVVSWMGGDRSGQTSLPTYIYTHGSLHLISLPTLPTYLHTYLGAGLVDGAHDDAALLAELGHHLHHLQGGE